MPVVRRVPKPFLSSLLERYWPEIEHLSNGLGSAAAFKIPAFRYVPDLNALFALARGWVITPITMLFALLMTVSRLKTKLSAVRLSGFTPSKAIDWPSAIVITALPLLFS